MFGMLNCFDSLSDLKFLLLSSFKGWIAERNLVHLIGVGDALLALEVIKRDVDEVTEYQNDE